MLIKNPDALKSWLVVVLEPICDADSSALARYVLALLKKDKPEKELKKVMIEQLDVFLATETKVFVDRLFNAISTEDYLNPPPQQPLSVTERNEDDTAGLQITDNIEESVVSSAAMAVTSSKNNTKTNDSQQLELSSSEVAKISNTPNLPSNLNVNNVTFAVKSTSMPSSSSENKTKESHNHQKPSEQLPHASHDRASQQYQQHNSSNATHGAHVSVGRNQPSSSSSQPISSNHVRSASPPIRTNADKENQPREGRKRRASLRSRSRSPRSRSRSNERNARRSRSPRDRRTNEREKFQRQFRNRSPAITQRAPYDRRRTERASAFDRRRIGSGGGGGSINNRANNTNNSDDRRSPRFTNNNNNSGENERKSRSTRSHSRSRSPSVERNIRTVDNRDAAVVSSSSRTKILPASANNNSKESNNKDNSRSNRNTPERLATTNLNSNPITNPSPNPNTNNEKHQRCRDFEEKGYCVRGETCPWDHGVNPVVFDGGAQQLMNMGLPEYNPDVPDMWNVPRTAGMPMQSAIPNAPSMNPFSGTVRPSGAQNVLLGGPAVNQPPLIPGEYARMPAVPPPGYRGPAPIMPFGYNPGSMPTPLQRELIPIPVVDAAPGTSPSTSDLNSSPGLQGKRRFDANEDLSNTSNTITDGPVKRKLPINSRLGPRLPSIQNNCSLELRKVPRGLNSITHLNNHFNKFGKIVNIQISYDGDPEAAIVTFSTHAEANVAYRSTEAVLNNRFIKVFWHNNQDNTNSNPNNNIPEVGGINRKNSQYHLNNKTQNNNAAKLTNEANNSAKTSVSSEATNNGEILSANASNSETSGEIAATTAASGETAPNQQQVNTQPSSLRLKNNIQPRPGIATNAIIRKKQEEQAKAVAQLASGLRKRKQELLQSYLKQMKSAVEIVERCEANDPQRAKSVETIKFLQDSIDKLRKEISSEQVQLQAKIQQSPTIANSKKTKEQQKKELLDIELELIAQQQEGNDTSAIQKRLEDLQRSLGVIPGSGGTSIGKVSHYGGGGGRQSGRGRAPYADVSTRVDRRPKTIVVTDFANDEADSLLGHFKHYGEITKHDVDREIPQLIISYSTRNNAERAFMQGKIFREKRLQITWAPIVQANSIKSKKGDRQTKGDTEKDADPNSTKMEINLADNTVKNDIKHKNDDILEDIHICEKGGDKDLLKGTDILPELRLEDEEEDEDFETRSWRR